MKGFDRNALAHTLEQGIASLGLELDARQQNLLLDYLALLHKWNAVYNLTAIRDPAQMVVQHLLDSLAAVPAFATANRILDVGAGGGLPGIVLAICGIARAGRAPLEVHLIDTVHKKTAFLTQVKAELGLGNVTVHTGRVEQLTTAPFDTITSRAFADLRDFVSWSHHLLADGGQFIALKGQQSPDEQRGLPKGWQVRAIEALNVPGMQAERHLVYIVRAPS